VGEGRAQLYYQQFVDEDGCPLAGAKVYHYRAGTTTDLDVWADPSKTTTLAQPATADGAGRVKFYGDGDYRLAIQYSDGTFYDELDDIRITRDTSLIWENSNGTTLPPLNSLNDWQLFALRDGSGLFQGLRISNGSAWLPIGLDGWRSVSDYGAVGDGTTDDSTAIQAAIDVGCGIVWFPGGTYGISTTLTLNTGVILMGANEFCVTIKALGAIDMIKSQNYDTLDGTDTWLVGDGVPHSFGIIGMQLDGQKGRGYATGNGLKIYGKRYTLDRLMIIDIPEVGWISKAGQSGGQDNGLGTSGYDMPECAIGDVWLRRCGSEGLRWFGPHDGYIHKIACSNCGADNTTNGLVFANSGSNTGAPDIGFIHVYSSGADGIQVSTKTKIGELITESNVGSGLVHSSDDKLQISIVEAYDNGDWAIDLAGTKAQLSNVRVRDQNGVGGIKVQSINNRIDNADIDGNNTGGTGISLEASANVIRANVRDYDSPGGKALVTTGGTETRNRVELHAANCRTYHDQLFSGGGNHYSFYWDVDTATDSLVTTQTTYSADDHVDGVVIDGASKLYFDRSWEEAGVVDLTITTSQNFSFTHLGAVTPRKEAVTMTLKRDSNSTTTIDFANMWITGVTATVINCRVKVVTVGDGAGTASLEMAYRCGR